MISTPATEPQTASHIDEDRLAWLALALSPGLGPKRILDARKELQSPSQLFELSLTDLEGLRFPAQTAHFIFDGKARRAAEEEWARVTAQSAPVLSYHCPAYPERIERRGVGRGGGRELRDARDRPLRRGAESRFVRRAGKRDQQEFMDA